MESSFPSLFSWEFKFLFYFSISVDSLHLYSFLLLEQNSIKQKKFVAVAQLKNNKILIFGAPGKYVKIIQKHFIK